MNRFQNLKLTRNDGFSLVEVMVAGAIFGVIALASAAFFSNQQKMNNFVEFRAKKVQLQNTISGQFLNDRNNCKCLFNGASNFPITGTPQIAGVTPTSIGRYQFVTPGDCSTATLPQPWITAAGVDDLQTESISILDVGTPSGGVYSANLQVRIRSMKEVNGPNTVVFSIPIAVTTTPVNATTVAFDSCSNTASGSLAGLDYSPSDNGILTWQAAFLNRSGGGGTAAGSLPISLSSAGGYTCGPLQTITLTNPAVTNSTRGAVLTVYTADGSQGGPAARFFTTSNRFVGHIGQVGRTGDGRSFSAGGDIYIPLNARQFRVQGCRSGANLTLYMAVKAVFN
jgi:prepilin-type N-terminal cleavage/methylation domain-containing protein